MASGGAGGGGVAESGVSGMFRRATRTPRTFPRPAAGGEPDLGAEFPALGVAERQRTRPDIVAQRLVRGQQQGGAEVVRRDARQRKAVRIVRRGEEGAGGVVDDEEVLRGQIKREDRVADASDVHLTGPGQPVRRVGSRKEGLLEEAVIHVAVFAGPALQDIRPSVAPGQPEGDGGGPPRREHVPELHEQRIILAPHGLLAVARILEKAGHVKARDAPFVEDVKARTGNVYAPDQAGKTRDPVGKLLHGRAPLFAAIVMDFGRKASGSRPVRRSPRAVTAGIRASP